MSFLRCARVCLGLFSQASAAAGTAHWCVVRVDASAVCVRVLRCVSGSEGGVLGLGARNKLVRRALGVVCAAR